MKSTMMPWMRGYPAAAARSLHQHLPKCRLSHQKNPLDDVDDKQKNAVLSLVKSVGKVGVLIVGVFDTKVGTQIEFIVLLTLYLDKDYQRDGIKLRTLRQR